jgi:hypothetical protein
MENTNPERKRKGENEELSFVQAWKKDLLPEEFPEGPYGAAVYNDQHPGKSTPWKEGQKVVSRFQDENPAFSDFKVPESDLPDL